MLHMNVSVLCVRVSVLRLTQQTLTALRLSHCTYSHFPTILYFKWLWRHFGLSRNSLISAKFWVCGLSLSVCTHMLCSLCRLSIQGMSISRPSGEVGKYRMILHPRDTLNKANPDRYLTAGVPTYNAVTVFRRRFMNALVSGINALQSPRI